MRAFLQSRSLRFWITVSMAVAVLPLLLAAMLGYALLNHGVIGSFNDIVFRQDAHAAAIQDLRLRMVDAIVAVDEFVEDRDPDHQAAYRRSRLEIESAFVALMAELRDLPPAQELARRAQDTWTLADRYATELLAVAAEPGDPVQAQTMAMFHAEIASVSDRLAAAHEFVSKAIEDDLDAATRFYERALWISGIAAGVSVLAIVLGIYIIGRVVDASVTRIVTGAALFADGDRAHKIDVQIPAELRDVADEFNRMAERIRESEGVLAEIAEHDSVTGLANRRAFDRELSEIEDGRTWSQATGSILVLDIDHFKSVNDTHGHAAGDAVLRAIGKALTDQSRPADRAFRIGGEEFAVLLPNTDGRTARMIAERLRQVVGDLSVPHRGASIAVTVSIGAATARDRTRVRDALEAADKALYAAKDDGRNRVVLSGGSERPAAAGGPGG